MTYQRSTLVIWLTGAAVCLLLWAACTTEAQPAPTGNPPASAPASQPAPALLPLDYQQSGGFAGVNIRITVTAKGEMTYAPGRMGSPGAGQLTDGQMRELLTLFREWNTLKDSYPAPPNVADGFSYRITYAAKTVTAGDGANIPEAFSRAQRRVMEMAQQLPAK